MAQERPRGAHFASSQDQAQSVGARDFRASQAVRVGSPDDTTIYLLAAQSRDLRSSVATRTAQYRGAVVDAPLSEDDSEPSAETVGKSAALMSALVIFNRITGFFRTWAQAYSLGATLTASAFTVANGLPNALYELVMGGMLVTAFLPVYVSAKKRAGRAGAIAYASNLLSLVTIFMAALAILSFIFAGEIIWTQSFSASAEFDRDLSIYFFRFFAISIVLYALSSVISSVLNAERDYFWSTAAPVMNNVVTTTSFLLYGFLADAGQQQLAILVLAVGSPLGVFSQVAMQIPALRRHGVRLRPRVDLHDPCIRETLSIGVPTLVVTFVSFATTSVQSSCSLSVNPNGASIIYYARIWYMLPYSVFAIPITTAMFTELSSYVASGKMRRFVEGLTHGSGQILFLLIPFAFYLIVFSPCLARILGGGRMSAEDVHTLAVYIGWLSVSLPGYGLCTYLQKACSSLRRMKLFAIAECIAGAVQIAICLIFTPRFGFNVVGFSSTFFFASVDLVTLLFLRRELGGLGIGSMVRSSIRATLLGAAGAALGFAILTGLQLLFTPLSEEGMITAFMYAVIGGIPAVLLTFGVAIVRGMPEVAFLSSMFGRLLPKRAAAY